MNGVEKFAGGLIALGYRPSALPSAPDHIVIDYDVESGRLRGMRVRLGLVVPADFPLTPPSGPHFSPHVHPIQTEGQHPTGRIHESPAFQGALGGAWQYWSRPFADWAGSKKTVAAYMSHIWRLWDSQ